MFRYKCKTFGKQFRLPNTTFVYNTEIQCQNDKTWSLIGLQCECRILIFLFFHYHLFLGSHCVSPPNPPAENNLLLQNYVATSPPSHGETLQYCCSAGGLNKFEHDITQDCLSLTCLENNTFSSVNWPKCVADVYCPDPLTLNTSQVIADTSSFSNPVNYNSNVRYLIYLISCKTWSSFLKLTS